MGKRRHSAVYGQAEGTGEDLDVSLDWLCSEADEPYENKEKSESIRLDEDEQKAEPYDMRNKRTSVKRTVIVCAVVLAALILPA